MKVKIRENKAATHLGMIEYMRFNRKDGKWERWDITEYDNESESEFIKDILDELAEHVSIRVILYRNQHGKSAASYGLRRLEGEYLNQEEAYVVI